MRQRGALFLLGASKNLRRGRKTALRGARFLADRLDLSRILRAVRLALCPLATVFRGALLLLGFAAAARAGLFDDEEARRQIRELRAEFSAAGQRLEAIDKRLETLSRNQLGFTNDLEALRGELAPLRGQLEVLQNALDAALKRQQDFYVDLDARLRKLETAAAEAPQAAGIPAVAETAPDPHAEMRAYETALAHFREARYTEAQAAFEAFIAAHPQSAMLPSAHYWLASSLYQQKRYDAAARVFAQTAARWPQDAKAPDALLAQANALVGMKDIDGASKVLETLAAKYPTSPAAETARARLKTLAPKKKR